MTREEIIAKWDALTPRERDAWVAEVVFGHLVVQSGLSDGTVFAYGSGGYNDICPRYSTDIAAAWKIVETYRSVGIYVSVHILRDNWVGVALTAVNWVVDVDRRTAPEAISLAAILVKLTKEVA